MTFLYSPRFLASVILVLTLLPRAGTAGEIVSPDWIAARNDVLEDQYGHRTSGIGGPVPATTQGKAAVADEPWRSVGPPGGDVEVMAASPKHPSIVFAGISPADGGSLGGALYRSEDGAETWHQVAAFSGVPIYDLVFLDDGSLYLAGYTGVWFSEDDGLAWSRFDLGLGTRQMASDVAVDPAYENRLWVGAYDFSGNYFVMRSLDGGASWDDVTPAGFGDRRCNGFAFDPVDTAKVFACFGRFDGARGFCVTEDYGTTWIDRTAMAPGYNFTDVVHDGTRVLVTGGQLFGGQSVGLLASSDDGLTWDTLHDTTWPVLAHKDIELDPDDPQTIFLTSTGAGVYRSRDGGLTWEFGVGGTEGLSLNAVRFGAEGSPLLYLGASSFGVLKSDDGGDSFVSSSKGISALFLMGIDANPHNLDELAVSFQSHNSGGIFTSLDGGLSWTLEPCPSNRWNAVRFAPDGTLHALNDGPSDVAGEGVYRRESDGSWKALGPNQGPLYDTDLLAIRFSESNPNLIIVGGGDWGSEFGNEATIWVSEDAGVTWAKTYEGPPDSEDVTSLEIARDGTDQLIVATFRDIGSTGGYTGGSLRSIDGGETWSETGLALAGQIRIPRMTAVPGQPYSFYAGELLYGGLYRSTDGGVTWSPTYRGIVRDLVVDPNRPDVVYIGTSTSPLIMRSEDGGFLFGSFDGGLDGAVRPEVLECRTGDRTLLMLATPAGAFLREMAVSSVPGLAGEGLGLRCYPNPFNPSTTLAFELPREETIRLEVFDVAGRLVKTLIDGEVRGRGHHQEVWRGRDETGRLVASGAYFYRLEAGEHGETKRMMLLK